MIKLLAICGEIVRTPSDDNEASSVGIPSGAQPLQAARDGHCFFILVTFGAEYEFPGISEGQASIKLVQFTVFALSVNITWLQI